MKRFINYFDSIAKVPSVFLHIISTVALFSLWSLMIYIVSNIANDIFLSPRMYFRLLEEIMRFIVFSLTVSLGLDSVLRKNTHP